MQVIAPNFVSVRLDETDKQNYVKLHEAAERAANARLKTADLYRAAMLALAEKLAVKGVK